MEPGELHCGGRRQRSVSPGKYISTARILPAKRGRKKNIYIWGHMCIKRGVVEKKEKIFNVCAEWFC
jgi:hypothetical protein